MNGNIGLNFIGKYHVEMIDSQTGKVKQSGDFHNIATITTGNFFIRNMYEQYYRICNIMCYLRVGSGTTQPSYTDTALTSSLWEAGAETFSYEWVDDYTVKGVASYRYPADSGHVGNVSEAGLRYQASPSGRIATHVLFTDSEGNPVVFEKTDLDILIVNVEIQASLTSSDNKFTPFIHPTVLDEMLSNNPHYPSGGSTPGGCTHAGTYGFFKFDEDKNFVDYGNTMYNTVLSDTVIDGSIYRSDDFSAYEANEDGSAYFTIKKMRLPNTSITDETYYRGVYLAYYGCFMLPNSELFPDYTIENIAIGTGDGETTTFENPLSYFKENTETIYIDNVALTRGTDYTINHRGNINKKFEICQDIKPETATSDLLYDDDIWSTCTYHVTSMFKPTQCTMKYPNKFDTSTECYGINADNPAILDFGEDVSFNFILGRNIRLLRRTQGGAFSQTTTTASIVVESSDDGSDWTEVVSGNISSNAISLDFDETIAARYWRISTDQVSSDATYDYIICTVPSGQVVYNEDCGIALGLCDPYIEFTTAPATDSVITMKVDEDIMMKNENFAIDIISTINMNITSGE